METSDERIFVDSNYFIALFNAADAQATQAAQFAHELDSKKVKLVISNFIFLEVVTVLSQRVSRSFAQQGGKNLLADKNIEIIHVNELLHQQTWSIFQEVQEKDVSFVDCSTIAVMRAENISTVLTFDQTDFKRLQRLYRFSLYHYDA